MENWRNFEREQKLLNEETSDDKKGFLDKAGDAIGDVLGKFGDAMTGVVGSAKDAVDGLIDFIKAPGPVHIRGFARFLAGNESTLQASFLSKKEIQALRKTALYLGAHRTRRKKTITYQVWRNLSKQQLGKDYRQYSRRELAKMKARGETPLSQKTGVFEPEVFNSLSRFLGAATVQRAGNMFVFIDHYDFNDANRKNNLKSLKDDLGKLLDDGVYSAVRRLAPYRQASGYEGYPIKIAIPIKEESIS